jgi:hypothetical protein
LQTVLEHFQKSGEFLSVYYNSSDWSRFSFGNLEFVNDEWTVLTSYTSFGDWDGYAVRPTMDVCRIEFDGSYERDLSTLIASKNIKTKRIDFNLKTDPLKTVFDLSKKERIPIDLWGHDRSMPRSGIIDDINSGIIYFQVINSDGKLDAKMRVDIDEITGVDIWSTDTRKLMKLMDEK